MGTAAIRLSAYISAGLLILLSLFACVRERRAEQDTNPQQATANEPTPDAIPTTDDSKEPEWKLTVEEKDVVIFYKPSSIQHLADGTIRVWMKAKQVSKAGGKEGAIREADKPPFTLFLEEYNCTERQRRIVSVINYDKSGQVTNSQDTRKAEFDFIPPGTLGENTLKELCSK